MSYIRLPRTPSDFHSHEGFSVWRIRTSWVIMRSMKILPVSHKPIKTTQFFQDHDHSPHLCRSECNCRSGVTGRSPEVTIHFSPIPSRDRIEIETQKWCQTTWPIEPLRKMCILTYLGHDLSLTWPDLRTNFQIDLSRSKSKCLNRLDEANTMVSFLFSYLTSKKLLMKNHIREKR